MKIEMETLSERQQEVFEALQGFIRERGYPPTMRDLARKLGIVNPTAVKRMIDIFEDKGLLKSAPGKSRAIRLSDSVRIFPDEVLPLPVMGRIVAGTPEEAIETMEEKIPIPAYLAEKNPKAFLLKIKGDSMETEFHDGDLVVVTPRANVHSKDVVAVLMDGEATIKQFLKNGNEKMLHPLNPDYRDIPLNREAKLIGKVIGLLRKF